MTCIFDMCTCTLLSAVLYVTFDLTLPFNINGWSNDNGNGNCNAVCSLGSNSNGNAVCGVMVMVMQFVV